jgi:hypothetical protein
MPVIELVMFVKRVGVLVVTLLIAVSVYFYVVRSQTAQPPTVALKQQGKIGDVAPKVTRDNLGGDSVVSTVSSYEAAKEAGPTNSVKDGLITSSEMATLVSMSDLLSDARRTQDPAKQAYAVYMPPMLCTAVSDARNSGYRTLRDEVPSTQTKGNAIVLNSLVARCTDYLADRGGLRTSLLSELKANGNPVSLFFAAYQAERRKEISVDETRTQLSRVLEVGDATLLQPLALVWTNRNAEAFAASLPADQRQFASGITSAAFDIAICRQGAECGGGSVALWAVCAKYGSECNSRSVEEVYRALFERDKLSFAATDKLADQIKDAIRARDTKTLWP